MRRREFLKTGAVAIIGAYVCEAEAADSLPMIDAHIHLFDPTRPEGVPWPEKTDSVLYKPALPDRYLTVTRGLDVRGAIAIECSPWESDNDWLLKVAEQNPIIVGIIGDLVPDSPSFHANLDRLSANPLFRGIRYGNLWNRNLSVDMNKPGFIDGLKALAHAKLVLDSANPDGELISALVRVKDKVPDLTIVIDHLPNAVVPAGAAREQFTRDLEKLGDSPSVFAKLSEIPALVKGKVSLDVGHYKGNLDTLWGILGENRVIYGSDWPNSDQLASYTQTLGLVRQYMGSKNREAQEKYFWRNSMAAYHWHPRLANQEAGS